MPAVEIDKSTFQAHLFIPRIRKRTRSKEKDISGYPRLSKRRVASTIMPKKRMTCFAELGILEDLAFSSCLSRIRTLRTKIPDRAIRRIPKQRGNMPEPAARKLPIGILKEK